ncbi:MAG: cell surface protein [Flavobacteriales bacterium]|nr:cell surface protein [Flavobacteriales bacterium]|tara:strand:+ start:25373 stop:26416 length:1044 start_codon:yes stop_codon:yes gene_type:complete
MDDNLLWDQESFNTSTYSGVFIGNEGNFMADNASLSFYDFDSSKVVNDIFYKANGIRLGDVAQSITIKDNLAYIVMNNSGKIQIMDIDSFTFKGKITGLTSPRHIHFLSDEKAYVSDLYAQAISIINPETKSVIGSINLNNGNSQFLQHSSEKMISWKKYVIVNCWSRDNKILFINSETDQLIDSITVVSQPNSMVIDNQDRLWILSDGGFEGSSYDHVKGALQCYDLSSKAQLFIKEFELDESPGDLIINENQDTLYFINHDVYRIPASLVDTTLELLIKSPYTVGSSGGINGISINPINHEIFISDAVDYSEKGKVYRYNQDGVLIDEFKTGIIPSSFAFKQSNE